MAETCSTVAILPGNYLSERYYRPAGSLHPWRNCKHGCRLLWSIEPFKKQPALTVFQVQVAFGKIRTLVAPSPQPRAAAPPSAYCNTSRPAYNSCSASPPSMSRSAVCSLPVICGCGQAWCCLCGAHVKQRLPENRCTDFQVIVSRTFCHYFAIILSSRNDKMAAKRYANQH